ncbi:MAG: ribulose-phosphate 3-epimerase [Promethearchaeota archaeon]
MRQVSVSIHAIDNFNPLIIKGLEGLDYIHVDVFDGKFCKNKQDNLDCFEILKKYTKTPIIGHFMVVNPINYIEKVISNIDIFEFHIEAGGNIIDTINKIRSHNKKVGIVLNPETHISDLISYLEHVDIVLIMSVVPGYSGQKFLPQTYDKVKELAKYKEKFAFKIEVDGGINLDNSKKLQDVDILCSASTILNAKDPNEVIELLKQSDERDE